MLKATEDLKRQQMVKEQERQAALAERIIPLPEMDRMSDGRSKNIFCLFWLIYFVLIKMLCAYLADLQRVTKDFIDRVRQLESDKYDLSYTVRQKDFEINELTIAVNDLRGKL